MTGLNYYCFCLANSSRNIPKSTAGRTLLYRVSYVTFMPAGIYNCNLTTARLDTQHAWMKRPQTRYTQPSRLIRTPISCSSQCLTKKWLPRSLPTLSTYKLSVVLTKAWRYRLVIVKTKMFASLFYTA